jgi:predicted O-methyltransferase YrrM
MKYDETDTDANERDTYNEFLANTSVYKNKIITLRGWSYDVLPQLRKHTESLDFLFIDGDHNYEGVKKDWSLYRPFLQKGSFVAFHDTEWAEGVQKIVAEEVEPNAHLWQKLPNLSVYKII